MAIEGNGDMVIPKYSSREIIQILGDDADEFIHSDGVERALYV